MLARLIALFVLVLVLVPATALAGLTRNEATLLRQMNLVRARHGMAPLRCDAHLERAARAHSRDMLATGIFRHGAFVSRMLQFDVKGRLAGENLAWGTGVLGTARGIVEAWLASPEHRANLLRASFTRVGIADLEGAFLGAAGAHVVTADFAG
ncbi:MAG: CAP domain-containing protein [Gaiellaceae bacterium]